MKPDSYTKYLFLYMASTPLQNFWAFSQGKYHQFVHTGTCNRYIRSQEFLPDRTTGICYAFTEDGYEDITREANRYGIPLNFYDDVNSCEQGEGLELHPAHIYGLSKPILLWQSDAIDKGMPSQ